MYSLKDTLSAIEGGATLSFRDATNPGVWPAVTEEGQSHSLGKWCKRFAASGKAVRRMKDDDRNVWAHMDRGDVIRGVRARLRNPFTINQAGTSLCGPASLLMLLAWRQPVDYVNAIAELLHNGVFTSKRGYTFNAEAQLLARNNPADVAEADWIFFATVRDSENITEDVNDGQGLEGLTWPGDVHKWVQQMLDLNGEMHQCFMTGEMDALRAGQAAIDAGGVAIMLVDSCLLTPGGSDHEENSWFRFRVYEGGGRGQFGDLIHSKDDNAVIPDHLVVLLRTNLGTDLAAQGELHVYLWSWSAQFQVVATPEGFSEYLWSVIAGVPT